MSKYLSGVYSPTYSNGGPLPSNPTTPVSNFVYGNQFIQGIIQLTADTKASLQSTYGASGVYIGMNTAGTYAGIKLLGPTAVSNGSYIDFTTAGVAYKGRILYDNNANIMQFYTNAAASAAMTINTAGITTNGIISTGNNLTPFGNLHLRSVANPTINNFIIEAGTTSNGTNVGWTALNFNGYNNGTEQRFNIGKNRWRFIVDQRTSSDLFLMDTYNGSALTNIYSINTAGALTILGTTDAVSATNGEIFTCNGGGAFAKSLWLGGAMNASGLSLTTSQTGGAIVIARMLATGMNAGSDIEMQFGQSTGFLNAGIVQFNYAGGGNSSNNVGIGFFGANNILQVYSSNALIKGRLDISNSSAPQGAGNVLVLNLITPSLPTGNYYAEMHIGVAESNYNTGIIQFNYPANGVGTYPNGNYLGLGMYGATNVLQVYSDTVKINGTLTATNFDISSASFSSLNVNNPGSGSTNLITALAPNLANGNNVQLHIGVEEQTRNVAVIQFNYDTTTSTNNNVGIGMYNANNLLQLYYQSAQFNSTLSINYQYPSSITILKMLNPNLNTGYNVQTELGVSESDSNAGIIQFNYTSSASSNNLGLGLWNHNNMIQIFNNMIKINASITNTLNVNLSGNGTVTLSQFFAPNMSPGGHTEMQFGATTDTMNGGIIQFNYNTFSNTGSNNNSVGIGFFGRNNVLKIDNGGINVDGGLTKKSGSFDIPHPDLVKQMRGHRLRHCFVESNTRGDNLYRYTVMTSDCRAEIQLPDYFKYLNESPQVFVSAVGIFAYSEGYVDTELEKVHIRTSVNGTFNVLVIGTRKDQAARDQFDPFGEEYIDKLSDNK
jgi:hypothetical protein